MITLVLALIIVLILSILIINKHPDFFFWLFLMLFFDPGGFFSGYFENNAISLIDFSDLFFIGMLLSILSIVLKKNSKTVKMDSDIRKMFLCLFFFQLYFICIYGFAVPYYRSNLDFMFFLQKNRMYFMALPIMYGVYIYTQRNINLFYKMLVYFSVIILFLYLITLLTKLPIIPLMTFERYQGTGIERISMLSYGLINWILPIATIIIFLKAKKKMNFPMEKKIYISAVLMLITLFLTLTRREYLNIMLSVILILILVSYVFGIRKSKLSRKILFPAVLGFVSFFILFPQSFNNTVNLFEDTISLVLTGQDTKGHTDYRVSGTGDMFYVKQVISENPIMGTGYIPYMWTDVVRLKNLGDTFAMAMDASAEVPIYGAFFRLGIAGVLLAGGIYFLLLRDLYKFLKRLRKKGKLLTGFSKTGIILLLLSIYLLSSIFTIQIYALFGDFYSPSTLPLFCVMLGLFYSLKRESEKFFDELYIRASLRG